MAELFVDDKSHDDERDTVNDTSSSKDDSGGERDEVKEVQLMAKADTNRIRLWRIVVTLVILCVGFAVTLSTYALLTEDEDDSFEAAVRPWFLSILGPMASRCPCDSFLLCLIPCIDKT